MTAPSTVPVTVTEIIRNYRNPVVRAYARARFTILRPSFLEEIGQYLPRDGRVLDLGCGFGLFSLYFASNAPDRRLVGVELSEKRVAQARSAARELGLHNVEYHVADALDFRAEPASFDAIYMLDLVHHLPQSQVHVFLERVVSLLRPGGTLIVKDVATKPVPMMLFTLALDRAMVGLEPIHYWSTRDLASLLGAMGLDVKVHRMRDYLPYPHVLYVCHKRAGQ